MSRLQNIGFATRVAMIVVLSSFALTSGAATAQNAVGWDAYRFANHGGGSYFNLTATPNQHDYVDISMATNAVDGDGNYGGGAHVGIPNLTFDPADYNLEVTYRLNAGHVADSFNVVARQNDGIDAGGFSQGEDFQWYFQDINNHFANSTPDADGFVTITRDVTQLPNPVNASTTESWDGRYQAFGFDLEGDALLDFGAHQGGEPNGVTEIQFQAANDGDVTAPSGMGNYDAIDISVKSIRFAPKAPTAVAEFTNSGVTGLWGSLAAAGAYQRDDGTALTNIIIDAQPDAGTGFVSGGAWLNTVASVASFDGASHRVELTAKLLPNNTATQMSVILKDLDGYAADTDPGLVDAAGEEHGYNFDLFELNASTMTTLSMPVDMPTWTNARSFGFEADGDGDATDFSLYEFQVGAIWESFERLNVEVESVRIVPVTNCDFDSDLDCDPADLDMLYANWGVAGGAFDVDGSGTVDGGDIAAWLTQASSPSNPYNTTGATFVLGDVDLDGLVNSIDLGLLLNNFNDTTGLLYGGGNLNDDMNVDSVDLGLLLNNFNHGVVASAAAVPEPSTLALLLMASLTATGLVRRRS